MAFTEEQRKTAWFEFSKSEVFKRLEKSLSNSTALDKEVRAGNQGYTVDALLLAVQTLGDLLDYKPAPVAPVTTVVTEVAPTEQGYSEDTDPNFPRRGPLENGWAFQQRKTNYREEMARRSWRERENARLAAQLPAQSTITRTNAEIRQRQLENDHWAAKKANQS